ncbi:MAG: polynucleotide adenylyltransferase PcnB [Candidatus Pelagadaptatus aseana]|uniref:polynucleotide adenylyltransferase PcnB n=1 Tax=Candidatus Pelagadaptatus aseana TaxID=3120508 RepID=UPI0039B170B2
MLKKLASYFSKSAPKVRLNIIPREKHNISRRNISKSALKVMQRLNQSGHEAYLVGGGVRDILLGGHPKDFDVATDATPEQVKQLFRNSRIIGRRFKIVHVRFGREIIEVTTFRAHHHEDAGKAKASRSESGMLLRDNVYGDIRSDAVRRDFTVNALYYTSENFSVYDFTGGMQDIARRKIRIIGNPGERYKEDPVRMLRAVRFAAKLDFHIDPATAKPILQLGELLHNIPAARRFDETLKLFMGGYGRACLKGLQDYKLLQYLIPSAAEALDKDQPFAFDLIDQAMANTDKRIKRELRVTPAFIFAAMLWPAVQQKEQQLKDKGEHPARAHQLAAQKAISAQIQATAIPKRFTQSMREIWELQYRLEKPQGVRSLKVMEHPRFRAAYDFLLLREQAGEPLNKMGDWWTKLQEAPAEEREQMASQLKGSGGNKRRRPRRRKTNTKQQPSNH